jgi:hypothetical protein
LTSVFTALATPCDQVIAACGSANVLSPSISISTGGPSETSATSPVPETFIRSVPSLVTAFLIIREISDRSAAG